ncbi:MAG: ABC transporter permease [Pyrinomonadaceae bacterium]
MLLVGFLIGLLNGIAITRFAMPPFIVTLTAMMFFSGLAIWLTQSRNIYGLPSSFLAIGKGSLFYIPYAVIFAAVILCASHIALSKSLFGRWLYAIGINKQAALISGVPVQAVTVTAYVLSGLCGALASMLYTSRLETGSAVLGQRILLDVVGSAVIGGISLFGGQGKCSGRCSAFSS